MANVMQKAAWSTPTAPHAIEPVHRLWPRCSRYLVSEDGAITDTCSRYGDDYKPKTHICRKGYARVNMVVDGHKRMMQAHRVVAETFIPNPDNKPQVNHINGVKTDNRADNLEWVTNSENVTHAWASGLRVGVPLRDELGRWAS